MFSANHIAGFLNQPYISRANQCKTLIFLHVDTNSHKLKVDQKMFGGNSQKWV